ncbi:MAG: acetyltransferase [Gallionellales bacterium RIFCSPLOWO2_12_FULL_59_22]|nr:MAG: acetyltransferase [Gallionellales bacterium RIFCSPLOWO2_02_FULL_59_110]OGT03732.1 MAG: acetyltransferase [Gallionellales bacterium RIFCSPLOWO2_02_58_13]OGT14232.1 MAG: acetyltransferase [Gallionellales bacterium RIFCSPLOWO2_12_FULL_59_22]
MNYDVFNGDADGVCALHQLRLAFPAANNLVTGTKRDSDLLRYVEAGPGDEVMVLDLALDKNRAALLALLDKGVKVGYFDHHVAKDIPVHPNLNATIDTSPDVCTSLLVNRYLEGKHLIWAVIGAFGDNLHEAACLAAQPLGLKPQQLATLRELGECLNYNSYGEAVEDLNFHPAELYRILHQFKNPFVFINENGIFEILKQGYAEDMALARAIRPEHDTASGTIYILPAKPWSRRVSGAFGNILASAAPDRAHAVLTQRGDGAFVVSVRAPQSVGSGADVLCSRFATGGGRKGAAGINRLPENELPRFVQAFDEAFSAAA